MERKWIVYIHVSPNDKRYVGITCRKKVQYRWGNNGNKYKNNPHLWNAIQKYGWDNFEHIIVATDLNDVDAKNMEIELINKYKSNLPQCGYNRTLGGDGTYGYKHKSESILKMKNKEFSEETRNKLSEKAKLRKGINSPMFHKQHSEKSKAKMSESRKKTFTNKPHPLNKAVDQYDLNGNYIQSFISGAEVKRVLGINNTHISSCCNGTRKNAGGYMWKYPDKEIQYG